MSSDPRITSPLRSQMGKPSTRRLSILLFLAFASLITVFQGIMNILLPAAVERLAPSAKVGTLALLSTLASVATVVALLAGGALSDRTRTRWGRRTPSIVLSCMASLGLLPVMAWATSIFWLLLAMPALWFTLNYYQSVLLAALPDRIPPEELGFASAAIGLGAPVGIFAGVNLSAIAPSIALGYLYLAIPLIAFTVLLLALAPEPSSLTTVLPARRPNPLRNFASEFGALRERNFALAFASRFLLFLGYFSVNGYVFYVLQDYVGTARLPYGNISVGVSIVMSTMTISWLGVTPVVGMLADRFRALTFIVATVAFGAGVVTLLPALSNAWPVIVAFALGNGLMFGAYFVLDLKLATLVLPSPDTAGRDLGILLAAGSAPGAVAPAIAAAIIAYSGYPALFAFGAIVAMASGLCAGFIRLRTAPNDRAPPSI